jgi:GDPmannose 4,6-dehydratase
MKALITGITGQDGSYLAELFLERGWEVHGVVRRSSIIGTERINHLLFPEEKITLHYGDLGNGLDTLIYDLQPDYIINMASMSHVRVSFDVPIYTMDVNAVGPTRILEAIRRMGLKDKVRFYQASSSEMFGLSPPPQNEKTPFRPVSPYGIAKLAAYHMTRTYRFGYGLFASNGILHNHESERRGETFVTKKIVRGAVRIKLGKQDKLILGNLEAKRDWGHSRDYMRAIISILDHYEPDDFVVATGEHYSIQDFVVRVFERLNLDWKKHVGFDSRYTRPNEVPELLGDPTKIRKTLNWRPEIDINKLVDMMIDSVMGEEQKNERD